MSRFQTVFLTGASSGLGRGMALHYAREGATVWAAARRGDQLESLVAEAAGAPGKVVPVVLDVGDLEALTAAVASAEQAAGGALDLVIANAGVGATQPATRMDWHKVQQVLHINTTAACVTVAAALPAMVARRRGSVVVVASLAAYRGLPGNAAYSASKAAVHCFFESLRVDLRGSGVTATTLSPGFVKSEMTAKNRFPMPFLLETDDAVRRMTRAIERGRSHLAYPLPTALVMRFLGVVPDAIYEPLVGLFRGLAGSR